MKTSKIWNLLYTHFLEIKWVRFFKRVSNYSIFGKMSALNFITIICQLSSIKTRHWVVYRLFENESLYHIRKWFIPSKVHSTLFCRTKSNFQKNIVVQDFWYVGEHTLLVNKIDKKIFITVEKLVSLIFWVKMWKFGSERKNLNINFSNN